MRTSSLLILLPLLLFQTACGLLIGNVKPVSEKSESYRIMDLSRESAEWERIEDTQGPTEEDEPLAIPDVAYQSKVTASIISLNSGCRPSMEASEQSLKNFTEQLFLGVGKITSREEREIVAGGAPALETTISGRLNDESVKLRTVVLRADRCLYDLTYVARPEQFEKDEKLFSQFVASLRLR